MSCVCFSTYLYSMIYVPGLAILIQDYHCCRIYILRISWISVRQANTRLDSNHESFINKSTYQTNPHSDWFEQGSSLTIYTVWMVYTLHSGQSWLKVRQLDGYSFVGVHHSCAYWFHAIALRLWPLLVTWEPNNLPASLASFNSFNSAKTPFAFNTNHPPFDSLLPSTHQRRFR